MNKLLIALFLLFVSASPNIAFSEEIDTKSEKMQEMIKFSFSAGYCSSILLNRIKDDKDPGVCYEVVSRYKYMLENMISE